MLIVVLVVCLGLVSLALLFGHSMLMAYRGSDDDLAGRQASDACEGAARYAEALMLNVTNDGDLPDVTTYQSQAVPVGDALFWFIGEPPPSNTNSGTNPPSFGLVDEASKLNLNRVSATILETLPGMTEDLAEAIINWRTPGGSAAAATTGAGAGISSTSVKEAPFESVEELAQVDGGTDLVTLYGNDNNLNHVLDGWEDTGNGQLTPGLMEYLTVFSREPRQRRDGTMRTNVNIAASRSAGVNLARTLNTLLGGTRGTQIVMKATNNATRTINSVLMLYVRGGMTSAELGTVTPYLAMSSSAYTTGLVNVNTASATVLSCLPGMTTQLASQLVAARSQLSAPSTDLSWVVPILGNTVAVEAGPYLTTRCYQVTADVAAVGRHGHGYRRTQYVIDSSTVVTASSTSTAATSTSSSTNAPATTATPQIVYRRDMAGLGWGLGTDARQAAISTNPMGGAL